MKISRQILSSPVLVPSLLAAAIVSAAVACSSGAGWDPIVIDASKKVTPSPDTPEPTPMPPPPAALGVAEPPPSTPRRAASPSPSPVAAAPQAAPTAPAPPSPVDSPGAVVAKHRQALDRGDIDAALALWAPDAVIELGGGQTGGRDVIRRWLADQSAAGATAGPRDRVESGANVAEPLGGPGGLAIYEVRAGKIVRARILR